ncbi:MAG: hypothetical protein L0229_26475, partial [Blastocatellia bacterium]|nr:hypothetical protein [Blastocatellia bacterium]
LAETRYFLHLSKRLGYVSDSELGKANVLAEEASKTLAGLMSSVQKQITIQTTSGMLAIALIASVILLI